MMMPDVHICDNVRVAGSGDPLAIIKASEYKKLLDWRELVTQRTELVRLHGTIE
jgi:hypothetical protein